MIKLEDNIDFFPILRSRAPFSLYLREYLQSQSYDLILVEFPEFWEDKLEDLVVQLPELHILQASVNNDSKLWCVADPADAGIEGVRQALQRRIPWKAVDPDPLCEREPLNLVPDPEILNNIGVQEYALLCGPILANLKPKAAEARRAGAIWENVYGQSQFSKRVLFIGSLALLGFLPKSSNQKFPNFEPSEELPGSPEVYPLHPGLLYFGCKELPFYLRMLEQNRMEPWEGIPKITDLLKRLLIHTRWDFMDQGKEQIQTSPVRVQKVLDYARRLAALQQENLPDLLTLIEACKGVFGDEYAISVFEAARFWPWQKPENSQEWVLIDADQAIKNPQSPLGDTDWISGVNYLCDAQTFWRNLELKHKPQPDQQAAYRYGWNPRGMCSHLPEDVQIENFNQHLRKMGLQMLQSEHSKSEAFSSSLKDGLDIRATLRNWHTGQIHVKEIPPARGGLDTVVILFDRKNPDKYPHRSVWHAEHENESTLSFYATDPFMDLIGPGIAKCQYGGLSLLFPPRPIPDPFLDSTWRQAFPDPADMLLANACKHSKEKNIVLVQDQAPNMHQRKIASQFHKTIIHLPLSRFGRERLEKLRNFHILNGHEVRSWASRFIG